MKIKRFVFRANRADFELTNQKRSLQLEPRIFAMCQEDPTISLNTLKHETELYYTTGERESRTFGL